MLKEENISQNLLDFLLNLENDEIKELFPKIKNIKNLPILEKMKNEMAEDEYNWRDLL